MTSMQALCPFWVHESVPIRNLRKCLEVKKLFFWVLETDGEDRDSSANVLYSRPDLL